MRDSIKANLIVIFIIAIVAFSISTVFANLTIQEDNESYKMIPIENNSFEPISIHKVPTILPKVETNKTNQTNNNTTHIKYTNKTTTENYTTNSNVEYW